MASTLDIPSNGQLLSNVIFFNHSLNVTESNLSLNGNDRLKYFASKCVCLMTGNGFPVPLISPDCIIMYFTHAEYMMH